MSSVGPSELIIIVVIGLLILGPERLPRVASQIGRWVGKARRTANQLRYQLEREVALADVEKDKKKGSKSRPDDNIAGSRGSQQTDRAGATGASQAAASDATGHADSAADAGATAKAGADGNAGASAGRASEDDKKSD